MRISPDRDQHRQLLPLNIPSRWRFLALCLASIAIWWLFRHKDVVGGTSEGSDVRVQLAWKRFEESLHQCSAIKQFPTKLDPQNRTANPRWNDISGQRRPIILRNATLFDGESIHPGPMDIMLDKGLITKVSSTASASLARGPYQQVEEYNVHLRFVTPGLVDMHSHHSIGAWPSAGGTNDDTNEMLTEWGPMTPFLRSLDGLKASDEAFKLVASGGITSSLILPGSANIMGGEGFSVKNARNSGRYKEYVVEETLLEYGIPEEQRVRYMKLACGENPKQIYHHNRMGNAWILREHLAKARDLLTAQDEYCMLANAVSASTDKAKQDFIKAEGSMPVKRELESTVGLLRGRVAFHNHCYLPEDMETMMRLTAEHDIRIKAFHHAIEAWQVPHMLKSRTENITIATFAEFSLYKWESYFPSLAAGKILNDHGIAVAYKSDHGLAETNAKYLAYQAGVAHAFCLPEEKSLQAITSVPAKALDLDNRIGYVRAGYDADIVIWDSHPLAIGATPLQVFIDGNPQLESSDVKLSMGLTFQDPLPDDTHIPVAPPMRSEPAAADRISFCARAHRANSSYVITGITRSFLDGHPAMRHVTVGIQSNNMTLVIENGRITCLSGGDDCDQRLIQQDQEQVTTLHLRSGHVLPGLTAVTASLGLTEITLNFDSGNGMADPRRDVSRPDNIDFAKYGVQLEGKAFARARMGGITRAISPPLSLGGFLHGVSVGISTDTSLSLHNGGIFQPDVGLHVTLDSSAMLTYGTISNSVAKIRRLIMDGLGSFNATVFGDVASGRLPLIIHANNHWDIQQIISIKRDFPTTGIVILGGAEAPLVASEISQANISIILTENRPAPAEFRHRDAVVGPPLTPCIARLLKEAGVTFAISLVPTTLPGDYRLHALALEAGWTAKCAALGSTEAVKLVSSNVEDILGLERSSDIVIWEGNPLEFGASVVFAFAAQASALAGENYRERDLSTSKLQLASCWPQEGN
ncbi:hypothetical protein BGZ61DRAFT_359170 [Ilyonectria robusta]|uniref:uncharacterized protein n=1 Tax=Ilyonectria robusta TaxID=1079257 RepID=UPI001E8CA88F|nr:uncharacterized protein BGZ61DRAFT_359170 [Ilyonectria robusta]KAH8680468.1 hypothetical protein BGZ61DRAFT_359170 [Ilyonectria robusta]